MMAFLRAVLHALSGYEWWHSIDEEYSKLRYKTGSANVVETVSRPSLPSFFTFATNFSLSFPSRLPVYHRSPKHLDRTSAVFEKL